MNWVDAKGEPLLVIGGVKAQSRCRSVHNRKLATESD